MEAIDGKTGVSTGSIGPFKLLALIGDPDSRVRQWKNVKFTDGQDKVTVYYPVLTSGNRILRPGLNFKVEGTPLERIDFASLMLALFLGTAALPHILIRYYTVPSPAAARKSTIVAIAAIGFFYILTLFMGLGAMTSGVVNLADDNMSAPLLARSFGTFLFSMISAIAFATVLGTVSGLIIAASGAVAHDILDRYAGVIKNDKQKVAAGKVVAFAVGCRRDRARDRVQGRERVVPGRARLRGGGLGEPARDPDDAVLEAHHGPGDHRLHHRGRRVVDRAHPAVAHDVRAVRAGSRLGAHPAEEPRASSRFRSASSPSSWCRS